MPVTLSFVLRRYSLNDSGRRDGEALWDWYTRKSAPIKESINRRLAELSEPKRGFELDDKIEDPTDYKQGTSGVLSARIGSVPESASHTFPVLVTH